MKAAPARLAVAAQIEEVGRILLIRWLNPAVGDVREAVERLKGLAARLKVQPIYIAVVPSESEPPSDDVRKEMLAMMDDASSISESIHLVLEGTGLKFSALRSIVASMFLVAGNRKTFVHDKIDGAVTKGKLTADEASHLRAALVSMAARAATGT